MTAFEQASIAWHRLWELKSTGKAASSHRREASQQLVPIMPAQRVKSRQAIEVDSQALSGQAVGVDSRALSGLQCIYGANAKPQSEGQASALQLVHNPSAVVPLIIVLPTSSGKSALFFSVAAMTTQQTVIVVVPFAALVDDIIVRGQAAGLQCEEWRDETSGHEMQQLIVVSADRAVSGEFLHYAKGLELSGQLAHVFFDECYVAFTDTSYRERLRELYALRYLDCPFTGLTATLMVVLEEVLRERLLIPNAVVFRRSTARRTVRYRVIDSGNGEAPSEVGIQFIQQQLELPEGKRGVVYVRSYATGQVVSEALKCAFYRARADDKGEVLQAWVGGAGGWIVATGALGTGINIEGIIYIVHIDRPYGLTSFVQQSGRGGRNGEVSDSIIIARVQSSQGRKRKGIMSEYSVEQVDEEAMTEFMQARICRRRVLSQHLDGESDGVDCRSTDSVFCDWCKTSNQLNRQLDSQSNRQLNSQSNNQPNSGQIRITHQAIAEPEEPNGQSNSQLNSQPNGQSNGQWNSQPNGQPNGQSNSQRNGQSNSQSNSQWNSHSNSQPNGQSNSQPNSQSNSQRNGQPNGQSNSQWNGQPNGQSNSQWNGQSNSQWNGQSNSQSNSQWNSHSNSQPNGQSNSQSNRQSNSQSNSRQISITHQAIGEPKEPQLPKEPQDDKQQEHNGAQVIAQRFKAWQESQECMIQVMDQLQGQCIYCQLIHGRGSSQGELHIYSECSQAKADKCGFVAYSKWREGVDLGQLQHCWECGLSQSICQRAEGKREWCEYTDIMLPGIFILHQRGHFQIGRAHV